MENIKEAVEQFIKNATLKEKVQLLTGADAWQTRGFLSKNIPAVVFADGPYGIRKVVSNELSLGESIPATAFPVSALLASTWNVNLAMRMGAALGLEARDHGVDVILGPGLNIKRTPLCGRNFEYFSEDPYVSGKIAVALIRGMQNVGVGATVKHYAANSQETERIISNSIVDERALHELYLRGFEIAVKEGNPALLMSSYNMINGVYSSENKYLLDILRHNWGYDGVVISDWGGMNDPVAALKAGHDLEMPGNKSLYQKVEDAYLAGELDLIDIDNAVRRIVTQALRVGESRKVPLDEVEYENHFLLAREIAADGMVLLENDGILPFSKEKSLGVIGAFAKDPRFQGAGSSQVNPKQLDNLLEALDEAKIYYEYTPGFEIDENKSVEEQEYLIDEAVELAKQYEQVVVMVGLPPSYESEGTDRKHLELPRIQQLLLGRLRAVHPRIVVVVSAGSVIEMHWAGQVGATVMGYLGGEASGHATFDILFGDVNPSGHLTETFPKYLKDTPSYPFIAKGGKRNIEYRESIFVGYRYYEAAGVKVAFPFGHGLSYSTFKLSNLMLSKEVISSRRDVVDVTIDIENTSNVAGQEVVQLYIGQIDAVSYKPRKELKAFRKIALKPGQKRTVRFKLNREAFTYWNINEKDYAVEEGTYQIYVGTSSENIHAEAALHIVAQNEVQPIDLREVTPYYYHVRPFGNRFYLPKAQFEIIYRNDLPYVDKQLKRPFTLNSPIIDAKNYFTGRLLIKKVTKIAKKAFNVSSNDAGMYLSGALETPLRSLPSLSGGMLNTQQVEGVLDIMNGKLIRGIYKLITKRQLNKKS